MENIDLVTGASGLLGSNLVHQLCQQGRRVRILVRKSSAVAHLNGLPNLETVFGDISDLSSILLAMRGVEHVYHCAARVSIQRKITPLDWQTNVVGTENMILAAKSVGIRRMIHCSSVDAIGLPTGLQPANEDTPWNWDRLGLDNAYARTKYESHQRVVQASQDGLDTVLVCPGYMFGAYDIHPSSGRMILDLAKRTWLPIPLGGNNFLDVADVVDAMITAARRGKSGETYILGNANMSYEQIFFCIASILGKKHHGIHLAPSTWERIAGSLAAWEKATGKEGSLNSMLIRLGNVNHYYDSSRAIQQLGMPQHPVEPAIERAVKWFRETGKL